MEEANEDDAPLEAEAAKREEWRGGGQLSEQDAEGHTLPESESSSASEDEESAPVPRTIAPPD
jgi:hypothetical protein